MSTSHCRTNHVVGGAYLGDNGSAEVIAIFLETGAKVRWSPKLWAPLGHLQTLSSAREMSGFAKLANVSLAVPLLHENGRVVIARHENDIMVQRNLMPPALELDDGKSVPAPDAQHVIKRISRDED